MVGGNRITIKVTTAKSKSEIFLPAANMMIAMRMAKLAMSHRFAALGKLIQPNGKKAPMAGCSHTGFPLSNNNSSRYGL